MDFKRNVVENTNDSAVISKYSMSSKGYALDPFLQYFVLDKDLKRSRSPLINRFYYLRFKAIEYAFKRCHQLSHIIAIGCGFDTSSMRITNKYFIEIDLPFVAINKARILIENQLIGKNEDFLSNGLNCVKTNEPFIVLRTENYCLIGADLRDIKSLSKFFIDNNFVINCNKESKIGLFNECSLCYVNQDISDSVIKLFIDLYEDKCHSITYLGFEQMKTNQTNDGFTRVMLNHFQTIGSPLKTFLTKAEIIKRFKDCLKFNFIDVLDMKTFFDDFIEPKEKLRINSLEMFDEYEEFDSVCSCYALTIAQLVCDCSQTIDRDFNSPYIETNKAIKPKPNPFEDNRLLYRFGHSSCLTNDNKIVIFGGFGCDLSDSKSHKRLSDFIQIDIKTNELIAYNLSQKSNQMQRIHSKVVELNENLFLISGGRSSPNNVLNNKIIKLLPESQTYVTMDSTDNAVPKVFRHLVFKQMNSKQVIQFGGKQSLSNCGSDVENNCYHILDTTSMKWQKQNLKNLFSGVYSHSGVSLDYNVFITNGGLNCDNNSFASNCVNIIDRRVPSVQSIHIKVGGMGEKGSNNKINSFDLRSNQMIDCFDIITESTQMLVNFSSEMVDSNGLPLLYLIGGGGNCFSFGTHFNHFSVLELFC